VNTNAVAMPDGVRNLTGKVVDGNPAYVWTEISESRPQARSDR
jgi:hypothetical protein